MWRMQYKNLSVIRDFFSTNLYSKQEQRNCLWFFMDQNSYLKEREATRRGQKYQ